MTKTLIKTNNNMNVKEKVRYVHDEVAHNMKASGIVVPIVLELFPDTKSVVDFGCGIGTWLKAFKDNGIGDVLGLDGKWYNKDLLFKYITETEFKSVDLEKPIHLDRTYDLVISLEVAEHLAASSADDFVCSLVEQGRLSFSALQYQFKMVKITSMNNGHTIG